MKKLVLVCFLFFATDLKAALPPPGARECSLDPIYSDYANSNQCVNSNRINSNRYEFGVYGEWIYFQPKFDNSYFVLDGAASALGGGGTRIKNEPNYHSGFRVGADFVFCSTAVDLRYTQLTESYSKNVTGNLFALVGDGTFVDLTLTNAFADSSFKYYAGQALLSQRIFDWCALGCDVHAGAHYAYLSNHNTFSFAPSATPRIVKEKASYWGVGPELGLDLDFNLGCDFAIVGRASTALLLGRSKSTLHINQDIFVNFENESDWRFVPIQNYRLGVNYCLNPSCWYVKFTIEAGYELLTYFRAFDTIVNRGNIDNARDLESFDTFSDVGMNGPYVNLEISF